MDRQKIFFALSAFGIILLLFLAQIQKPIAQGKISKIEHSQNKLTILLQNQETPIILFTEKPLLNLKQNQEIIIYGKQETYKQQKQIIADKILQIK